MLSNEMNGTHDDYMGKKVVKIVPRKKAVNVNVGLGVFF